jgi:hypothetical protein
MSLGVLSRTPASNSSTKMAGAPALAFGSQQKKSRENEDRAPRLKTLRSGEKACTSYHGGRWCPAQRTRHAFIESFQWKAIQLRMARAAIGWGVRELAEKAGVTANTVTARARY